MNDCPKFIEVGEKKYPINTDFKVALECDSIVRDESIGDYEKALAIIYKLFGEEALNDFENHEKIMKLAAKYLQCGKSKNDLIDDKEPSMDFEQDMGYIRSSFMSDYHINIDKEELDWWTFCDLMNGLTEYSALNRIRMIREEPLKGKKGEELQEWIKRKKQVELKPKKTKLQKELDKVWEEKMRKE